MDCFPLDDGKDTLVKYINLVDSRCNFSTIGDFKVLYDGDSDSVVIKTRNWSLQYYSDVGEPIPILDSCGGSWINSVNLDDRRMGDTMWFTQNIASFNSKLWFTKSKYGGSYGKHYNGFFEVNSTTLECYGEFQLDNRPLTAMQRFKGRKIK